MAKEHRKPAAKTVHFRVGRGLIRESHEMPESKEDQEQLVMNAFVRLVAPIVAVRDVQALNVGHDFSATVDGRRIDIQLTEIADRRVAKLPPDPHVNLTWKGEKFETYDPASVNESLRIAIENKLKKNYAAQSAPVWLLVWSSIAMGDSSSMWMPHTPFKTAREMLAARATQPFQEIWYVGPFQGLLERVWPI